MFERLPFGLDFWWVHLFHLGVLPRSVAIGAGLLPLAAAAWLIRIALRRAAAVQSATLRLGFGG